MSVLLVIEFVADKIPYVDSLWDSVRTVIRPTIAAVIGVLIAGHASTSRFLLTRIRRRLARLRRRFT